MEAVENDEKGKNGGKRSRKTSFFTLFLNFFEKSFSDLKENTIFTPQNHKDRCTSREEVSLFRNTRNVTRR